jgi:hypothetical protein
MTCSVALPYPVKARWFAKVVEAARREAPCRVAHAVIGRP